MTDERILFETDKRILIEYIKKYVGGIQFTEHIDGDCIGIIHDNVRDIDVMYRRDNLGQYLELSYSSNYVGSAKMVQGYLSRWFVNGRFEIKGDSVRLFSIIPVLDNAYLSKQIKHALIEIWDMYNVAKSEFNKKEYNLD